MKNRGLGIILSLSSLLIFITACASGVSTITTPVVTSSSDGASLVQVRCTACHPIDRIMGAHYSTTEWKSIVDQMIANGAQLSPEEESVVVQWLAAHYGP